MSVTVGGGVSVPVAVGVAVGVGVGVFVGGGGGGGPSVGVAVAVGVSVGVGVTVNVAEAQIVLEEFGTGAQAVKVCWPTPAPEGTVTMTVCPLQATPKPAVDCDGLQYTMVAEPIGALSNEIVAVDPAT